MQELVAEIAVLEKQRDELEAELKKVFPSLCPFFFFLLFSFSFSFLNGRVDVLFQKENFLSQF